MKKLPIKMLKEKPDLIIYHRRTVEHVVSLVTVNVVKWHLGKCSKCNFQVTYSDASRELLDQHPDLILVCLECAVERIKTNPDVTLATTPKHMLEIERIRLARLRGLN